MKYDIDSFTYGVELEYADVSLDNRLPNGCSWNKKDYTIVNSSGVANDPLGKTWRFGGEINTRPTKKIGSQVNIIARINRMLDPKPAVNYRCNLHIHVGVPGLRDDLKNLKRLLEYVHKYQEQAFAIVEPIPKPLGEHYPSYAFKDAMLRYRRRLVSHQYKVPEKNVKKIMNAKTPQEFLDGHANVDKKGKLLWFITPRAGINLRQLWETDTVEFRHFPGTINLEEIYCSLLWCKNFMENALINNKPPSTINLEMNFPLFSAYIHEIDLVWRKTTLTKNSRKQIIKNLKDIKLLDIDEYRMISSKIESGYSQEGMRKWI